MIINIRGTNGSGKTFVIQSLMDLWGQIPTYDHEGRISGHNLGCGAHVVGRYTTATGGCDTIDSQEEVIQRINRRRDYGPVLFEGLLISGVQQRWIDYSRQVPDFRWMFLNTPIEECVSRVQARRAQAGNDKVLNQKNLRTKHRAVYLSWAKCRDLKLPHVYSVTSGEAVDLVRDWLSETAKKI